MEVSELERFTKKELKEASENGWRKRIRGLISDKIHEFWDVSDVQIYDDETPQGGAIRFNLFHIMQSAGRDGRTGMGAKGLSGEGYEGHYFWDTEMYVLPVSDLHSTGDCKKAAGVPLSVRWPQARDRARSS